MKLSAGQGYTYLTRQVAAFDSTEKGHKALSDYYSEKGERPGVWLGRGVAGLESLRAGDRVTEDHMRNLFGLGIRPDAEEIQTRVTAECVAQGMTKIQTDAAVQKAIRLGNPYRDFNADESLVEALREAYRQRNTDAGLPARAAIPADERAAIRSRIGTEFFTREHGRAPLDERELTGYVTRKLRPQTTAVAGFDLTFSPVKSVSALWAVAPKPVTEAIARCHDQAVADALKLAEDRYAYTRRGDGGVRHEDITGLVAAAFTHRDSRAGDPDLHTHVAVSNKVQSAVDGKWLALDGATLYRGMVDISEAYNTALEAHLNTELGLTFSVREELARDGGQPVREVVGVPTELLERWSTRTLAVDTRAAQLAAQFQADHGRAPNPVERRELRQQANLETREAKHEPRSEAEQRAVWAEQAREVLGSRGVHRTVSQVRRNTHRHTHRVSDEAVEHIAQQVLQAVETGRARWRTTHVSAEARRMVRARDVAPELLDATHERVMAAVMGDPEVVPIVKAERLDVPTVLHDKDGRSQYTNPHSELFVTRHLLRAEQDIVRAAGIHDRVRLYPDQVETAITRMRLETGRELNPGQAALVSEMGTSGARVQLALAPAGSGKTTAMQALSMAWQDAGGTVIGLGPSATAAAELGASIGARSDTIASLTVALRNDWRLPGWARSINEHTMVMVDEAGMAGTIDLHEVIGFVTARGGQVRLIGDDQQLSSIAAGGVLRDIATTHGAISLTELVRFNDPTEAAATQAMRAGDTQVIGWMLDHQRVHVDPEGDSLDTLYNDWKTDRAEGADSVMVAFRHADVTELNQRARADRLATLTADDPALAGGSVRLTDGLEASAGDLIVTTENDRTNRTSATDFVRNADRWQVQTVGPDGSLQVKHARSGRVTVLSPDYVAEHVRLAYAITIHSAQGITVDRSRTYLTGAETRQMAYVALSRGRDGNHVYLGSGSDADPHAAISPEQTTPTTPTEVLEEILGRDGAQMSATTEMRLAADPEQLLGRHAAIYRDAILAAAEHHARSQDPDWETHITEAAEKLLPGLTSDRAWDTLRGWLAVVQLDGTDPVEALREAIESRELGTAADRAAVLWWRLSGEESHHGGPLPWLMATPEVLARDPEFGRFLGQLDQLIRTEARAVAETARTRDDADMPAWSHPLLGHRQLAAELAVWRAATRVPENDPVPQGTRQMPGGTGKGSLRSWQQQYAKRIDTALGVAGQQWKPILTEHAPAVLKDPWWPVLGRRLDAAGHLDTDNTTTIATLLETALGKGPLPDDYPASALWYRIAGDLAPAATLASDHANRLRPEWIGVLTDHLDPQQVDAITSSPAWAGLVSAVHHAHQATGADAHTVIADALALTHLDQIPDQALAQLLAYRVTDLARTPIDPIEEATMPPDPQDNPPTPDDLAAHRAGDTTPAPTPIPIMWPTSPDHFADLEPPALEDELPPDPHDLDILPADALPVDVNDLMAHQIATDADTVDADTVDADTVDADTVDADTVDADTVDADTVDADTVDADTVDAEPNEVPVPEPVEGDWSLAEAELERPADVDQIQPDTTSTARIVELTTMAADFYAHQYEGSSAAGYIAHRFGTDLTDREDVTIGYAPGHTSLTDHLRAHGARPDELVDAGLASWRRGGVLGDVFADRVVIGLRNPDGDLVGFTGRAAPGVDGPKYINTPTTAAFNKGALLFGLAEHRDQIAAGAIPVVTEGAFDAIAVTLAGDGHTVGVAPCGTALTAAQVDLLTDAGAHTVLDAVDTDTAGQNAARRHFQLYNTAGLDSHQLLLHSPDHTPVKDPAELHQRDAGHTLAQVLSLGVDNPTLAAQIISSTVFDNATRIRENILVAHAAAEQLGTMIGTMPIEQWEDHVRLAADLIAQTHPSDASYYHDLVDQILDAAATQAADWNQTKPEDPAMTPTRAPRTDWDALNARMAALRTTTPDPARPAAALDQQNPTLQPEPTMQQTTPTVKEAPMTPTETTLDTTTQQALTDAEKPVLTALERLQQMRQNLHEQERTTEQTWQDARDQMPLEDTTIDQDRSILD